MAYLVNDYDRTSPPNNINPENTGSPRERIWNVFKPTVTLDEMSLKKNEGEGSKTRNVEDIMSVRFPFIKINNYILSEDEIVHMSIDSTNFLPTIMLSANFASDLFLSKHMPKDGDVISVMIRNKSDMLQPIRNDYVITGTSQPMKSTTEIETVKITFFGELFVPGLKSYLGSVSYLGTSMEVLKAAAKELELGFNSNETNTDDRQLWYSISEAQDFILDTTAKAWKNDNSFFDCWIDVYYNLNFVNIQKELLSSEDNIDFAALLNNVDNNWDHGLDSENTAKTAKVFSNFIGLRNTSNYITRWKPDNRSSAITFEHGTRINVSFFEHQDSLYQTDTAQKYWNFEVPPNYDTDKVDSHIILRGRPAYDPNLHTDEQARANYNYPELYARTSWMGIQYTISDPDEENTKWTGNHHRNYMRAQLHNYINLIELDKLNVSIKVQGTNTNFIKGEKIPIAIVKNDPVELKMARPDLDQTEELDFFYSGWYIIKGFKLDWAKNDDSILSDFSQTFVLTRREWPTPEPVKPVSKLGNENNVT